MLNNVVVSSVFFFCNLICAGHLVCALIIQQIIANGHHFINCTSMDLRFTIFVACTVDHFVDRVVQPQHVRVRFERGPIVGQMSLHQSIDIKLIIAAGREQLIVAGQIVEEHTLIVHHAGQCVIDDGHAYTMRWYRYCLTVQSERGLRFVGGR